MEIDIKYNLQSKKFTDKEKAWILIQAFYQSLLRKRNTSSFRT